MRSVMPQRNGFIKTYAGQLGFATRVFCLRLNRPLSPVLAPMVAYGGLVVQVQKSEDGEAWQGHLHAGNCRRDGQYSFAPRNYFPLKKRLLLAARFFLRGLVDWQQRLVCSLHRGAPPQFVFGFVCMDSWRVPGVCGDSFGSRSWRCVATCNNVSKIICEARIARLVCLLEKLQRLHDAVLAFEDSQQQKRPFWCTRDRYPESIVATHGGSRISDATTLY